MLSLLIQQPCLLPPSNILVYSSMKNIIKTPKKDCAQHVAFHHATRISLRQRVCIKMHYSESGGNQQLQGRTNGRKWPRGLKSKMLCTGYAKGKQMPLIYKGSAIYVAEENRSLETPPT
jgi:hypothetical protein